MKNLFNYIHDQLPALAIKLITFAVLALALPRTYDTLFGTVMIIHLAVDYALYRRRPVFSETVTIFKNVDEDVWVKLGKLYIAQAVLTSPPNKKFIADNAFEIAKLMNCNINDVRNLHTQTYILIAQYLEALNKSNEKLGFKSK